MVVYNKVFFRPKKNLSWECDPSTLCSKALIPSKSKARKRIAKVKFVMVTPSPTISARCSTNGPGCCFSGSSEHPGMDKKNCSGTPLLDEQAIAQSFCAYHPFYPKLRLDFAKALSHLQLEVMSRPATHESKHCSELVSYGDFAQPPHSSPLIEDTCVHVTQVHNKSSQPLGFLGLLRGRRGALPPRTPFRVCKHNFGSSGALGLWLRLLINFTWLHGPAGSIRPMFSNSGCPYKSIARMK